MNTPKSYLVKGYRSKMRQVVVTKEASEALNEFVNDFPDVKKGYFVSAAIMTAISNERVKRQLEGKA